MSKKFISRQSNDTFIAFAVLIQSCLVIFQIILISLFGVEASKSTVYRFLLTAIPLFIAILISFNRRKRLFLIVYGITIFILCWNAIIYPRNVSYLIENSIKFLLPVVIPSALCLMTLTNVNVIEDVLYKISWIALLLVLVYMFGFIKGLFTIEQYDMSFSYALLLPMVSLYSRKKYYSVVSAFFLFFTVLAIGSRGAAVIFVVYVVYDAIQYNRRLIIPLIVTILLFIISLPYLIEWLEGWGISSRTLYLLANDEVGYMSGREGIYSMMSNIFLDNYLFGIGLFGDRYYLNGFYAHNIILEIYLNWGLFTGTFIIFIMTFFVLKTYIMANRLSRAILVKYFLATIVPLLFSNSYLINYNFGIFIGVVVLMNSEIKRALDNGQVERKEFKGKNI